MEDPAPSSSNGGTRDRTIRHTNRHAIRHTIRHTTYHTTVDTTNPPTTDPPFQPPTHLQLPVAVAAPTPVSDPPPPSTKSARPSNGPPLRTMGPLPKQVRTTTAGTMGPPPLKRRSSPGDAIQPADTRSAPVAKERRGDGDMPPPIHPVDEKRRPVGSHPPIPPPILPPPWTPGWRPRLPVARRPARRTSRRATRRSQQQHLSAHTRFLRRRWWIVVAPTPLVTQNNVGVRECRARTVDEPTIHPNKLAANGQKRTDHIPLCPTPYYHDIKSNQLGVTWDLTPSFAGSEMKGNGERELRREAFTAPTGCYGSAI